MAARWKLAIFLLLGFAAFGGFLVASPGHWLKPHGRVTCGGQPGVGAKVYRSQRGDLFVYAPNIDIQIAIVSPREKDLGRCNTTAFTPVLGYLFSREAEPDVQCTSMWKGGGSTDVE